MALRRRRFRRAGISFGRFSLAASLIVLTFNLPYFPPLSRTVPAAHATPLTGLGIWSPTKASSAVIDPAIATGGILQMNVNASGGTLLNAFDITVSWDQTVLNGTSVTNKGGIFDSPMFFLTQSETRSDHVRLSGALLGNSVPANGTIISFRVKVLSQGSTLIRIDTATQLLNGPPPVIPYFSIDGFFSNKPGDSDLLLSSEAPSSETVTIGDPVQIRLGVQDIGPLPMLSVNVTLYANGAKINSTVLNTVTGNTAQSVVFTWNTTGFSPGPYVMNATVTTPSPDAYSGDNTLVLEQITLVIHELAIVSVAPATNNSLVGSPVGIAAAVKNLGTVSEYANVTIYANDTATTYLPINAECYNPPVPCSVLSLLVHPGATQSQFIFQWNTTGLRVGTYNLKGVVSVITGERNVANNVLVQGQVTLYASFSHDLGVEWDPPNTALEIGANYTFTLGVHNGGKLNDTFTLSLLYDNQSIFQTTGSVDVNKTFTTMFGWKTISLLAGSHLLMVTVTDDSGKDLYPLNNTETSRVSLGLNTPPVASFTFSPSAPSPGASVFFNGTGSSDPDPPDGIKYYIWDFGDGGTGGGGTITHTYGGAGSYTVKLTVWDDYGAQNSTAKTITVAAPQPPPQTSSLALYIGITVAAAAIVAAGLFLLRRRKTRQRARKGQSQIS